MKRVILLIVAFVIAVTFAVCMSVSAAESLLDVAIEVDGAVRKSWYVAGPQSNSVETVNLRSNAWDEAADKSSTAMQPEYPQIPEGFQAFGAGTVDDPVSPWFKIDDYGLRYGHGSLFAILTVDDIGAGDWTGARTVISRGTSGGIPFVSLSTDGGSARFSLPGAGQTASFVAAETAYERIEQRVSEGPVAWYLDGNVASDLAGWKDAVQHYDDISTSTHSLMVGNPANQVLASFVSPSGLPMPSIHAGTAYAGVSIKAIDGGAAQTLTLYVQVFRVASDGSTEDLAGESAGVTLVETTAGGTFTDYRIPVPLAARTLMEGGYRLGVKLRMTVDALSGAGNVIYVYTGKKHAARLSIPYTTGDVVTKGADLTPAIAALGDVYTTPAEVETAVDADLVPHSEMKAAADTFGHCKPDGTTITAVNGVLSAASARADWLCYPQGALRASTVSGSLITLTSTTTNGIGVLVSGTGSTVTGAICGLMDPYGRTNVILRQVWRCWNAANGQSILGKIQRYKLDGSSVSQNHTATFAGGVATCTYTQTLSSVSEPLNLLFVRDAMASPPPPSTQAAVFYRFVDDL